MYIVKLSYDHDILYLVSGPFLLLKNTFLLNSSFDETARSVSGIVRKVYIYLFRDCKYLYCEYFGGKISSPSHSVLEIGFCPNMDMAGRAWPFSDFPPICHMKLVMSLKYLPYDVF